jgi:hypothetical protein
MFKPVVLSLLLGYCPADPSNSPSQNVSCSIDKDCRTPDHLGSLFQDGGDATLLPVCCKPICLLPAGACDTGYRYLTSEPSYGACVAVSDAQTCPPLPSMDMSKPTTD